MIAGALMIGDWVRLVGNELHSYQIEEIRKEHGVYRYFLKDTKVFATEDEIEPIPLTHDILEKNGWKYEFDKEEYRVKYILGEQGKNCWLMWSVKYHIIDIQRQDENLDMYNLCITKVCVPCEYVHQLQQALRVSELREMADDFKV